MERFETGARQNVYPAGPYGPGLATLNGPALYRNLRSSTDSRNVNNGRIFVLTDGGVQGATPALRQVLVPVGAGAPVIRPGKSIVQCPNAAGLLIQHCSYSTPTTGFIYPNVTAEFFSATGENITDEHPLGGQQNGIQFAAAATAIIASSQFMSATGWTYNFEFDTVIFRNYTVADSVIIRGLWVTDKAMLSALAGNLNF
jgi:hypothetical protein